MESAYSVTWLSIAYMVAAHKHTHTTINDYSSGFKVESWALTYRSLGWVVERHQCASLFAGPRLLYATLRPHVYNSVQIQTLLLPAVASLDKE